MDRLVADAEVVSYLPHWVARLDEIKHLRRNSSGYFFGKLPLSTEPMPRVKQPDSVITGDTSLSLDTLGRVSPSIGAICRSVCRLLDMEYWINRLMVRPST